MAKMKLKHRIADRLTGGEFSKRGDIIEFLKDEHDGLRERSSYTAIQYAKASDKQLGRIAELQARLDRIAGMETPNCAHIGKRMARVARGEE